MESSKEEKQQARDIYLFYLLYGGGLRMSEACGIKNKEIHLIVFKNTASLEDILSHFFDLTEFPKGKAATSHISRSCVFIR